MTTTVDKQLGQARPGVPGTPVTIYNPAAGVETRVSSLVIANTTGSSAKYRVFHDDNGSTFDQTTALYYDVALDANRTIILAPRIDMADDTGNIGVDSDVASALTFTLYGTEVS